LEKLLSRQREAGEERGGTGLCEQPRDADGLLAGGERFLVAAQVTPAVAVECGVEVVNPWAEERQQ
jgi:hypothetical protein